MAKVTLIRELLVKTENKVGMLAEVAAAIAGSGVNIKALSAFAVDGEAIFRLVTSDNMRAIQEIKAKNLEALEKDVVAVELENRVGAALEMAKKLKDADIDITYIYGSTNDLGAASTVIFNCNDNEKAVKVISG